MRYRKTRQPIQIWSPLILNSIYDENFKIDLSNAESLYKEEDIIWLSPEVEKVARWKEDFIYHLMIPSKTINKITVYHVDELGHIYPSIENIKNLNTQLYLKWFKKEPEIHHKNKPLKIAFPRTTKTEASYEYIEIKPDVAFIKGYKKNNKIVIKSGKKQNRPIIIDYEFERLDYFLQQAKISDSRLLWPEPFNYFFPAGGGANVLDDFYTMKNYLKLSSKHRTFIIKLVQDKINSFISNTESSLTKSWFNPKLNFNENTLLSDVEFHLGLHFDSVGELEDSEELENKLNKKTRIKRAYSWLGYFWWEFYQDILRHTTIKFCENCGQIISGGRQDRIYCTEEENYDCWKSRAALRQKKKYHRDRKSPVA